MPGEEAWWSVPLQWSSKHSWDGPRGALVKRDTHPFPTVVEILLADTDICDKETDSHHGNDRADNVHAQAALQLKKTQRVRVGEENDCSWDEQSLNKHFLMWILGPLVRQQVKRCSVQKSLWVNEDWKNLNRTKLNRSDVQDFSEPLMKIIYFLEMGH